MEKLLSTLSLAKPRYNAEEVLETYEPLVIESFITVLINFVRMCKRIYTLS
jgi:hypothetical protein